MKNKLTALILLILFFTGVSFAQVPGDNATGVSVTTNFAFTAVVVPPVTHLQVSTNNTFTALVLDKNLANGDASYTFSSLDLINALSGALGFEYNTTYYWRIYDMTNTVVVEPATFYTFTTVLATPTLTNPAIAATGVSITPTLSWTLAASSANVQYFIDYDPDGTAPWANTVGPFGASPQVLPVLSYNTSYGWQVRAEVTAGPPNAGETTTSATRTFTTELATPVLTSPSAAANNQLISPTLNWTLAGGIGGVTYDLQYYVGAGAFPGTTVAGVSSGYILAGLGSNQTVTWRIIAKKAGEADKNSASSTFTTYTYPTPTPINGAINQNVNTLTQVAWTAINEGDFGNGPYDVEVYIGANDGTPDFSASSTANLFFNLTNPLLYNQLYTWRVRDTDISGGGADGTWHQFTFTTQAIPAPTQVTPANTLTGVPIRPTFSWTWSGVGAVTYRLEVSASNTFGTTLLDTTGTFLSVLLPEAKRLLNNTSYYWRVTATQGFNSAVSPVWSFHTTPVVSISPINPINGSVNVEFNPTYFSFQVVNGFSGSLKYLVQYRVNATVPTIAEWGGASTFTLTNLLSELPFPLTLLANSKYYWRVVILNSSDQVVSYSGNYYFTTKSGAPTPYLSYPIGGQPVATNTPSFYWYVGTYDLTNLTFNLVVAQNAAFTVGVQTITNISGLQYDWVGAPFTPGTTYYWKIITFYKRGTAEEQQVSSTHSSFKALGSGTASTPFLSYPIGSTTVYTTTPTLYWYTGASNDGVDFDVHIKLSTAGGYTKIADNTANLFLDLSGGLFTPFTLTAGSTYNWYVVAEGDNGTFTSSVGTFIVSSSIGTGHPVASWPVSNPSLSTLTPSLYWYMYGSQTGLTKYVIKYKQLNASPVDWDIEGGTTNVDPVSLASTTYDIPSNLTAGAKYYWAIAGFNGGERATPWSEGSFTISSTTTLVNVYLSTPVGGTTVYTLTPTLYWYATGAISGITSYSLKYSNTSNLLGGAPPAFVTTVNTGTNNFFTLPSNPALAGATIYWQVTVNYTGGSNTSTTGSFVIDPVSSSVVPLAGSPINNIELKTTAATLSWFTPAPSKSKLTFSVEYAENKDFANSKIVTGLVEPKLSVSGLKENTTYYWRAKSLDSQGSYSKYSDVAIFRTSGKLTSVTENLEIPNSFELAQNYPNPFNPTTLISYSLPKGAFVTLKVYDMLGKEVKTLVSKEVAAGKYSIEWNGDDNFGNKVSTGAYVYRITAGDFVSVKKMLLIK